ncbi:hypothetical protein DFJ58DRAFT_893663 [Suillus subalutaceus]|uniref:uncharacterized protein n=1 Tax=Suillus subalutaceus TaxID=48586 RepID=UPI001B8600D5|nr:uncharacterized protein DFJ58DRAFT_893663 [Suillus subalutaceus]KAG1845498.1 hypothetical protein DFJ58DRAFT_893663 [Suillus subalutaceus]
MATKSEVFDDGKSITSAPPPYNETSTAASSTVTNSVQCTGNRLSLFSFLWNKHKQTQVEQIQELTNIEQTQVEQTQELTNIEQTQVELAKIEQTEAVLSHIHDIVSFPNFMPVAPIINTFAAALLPAEFSDLLQNPNIEGHTAMYWAVVNGQREAFSVFAAHIPQFSSVCSSDLRLACMSTSNHALFMQLNLGHVINSKDESLRHFLGCPPDEVQVHDKGDRMGKNQFVACFCIRMFQKRLRTAGELGIEFIAAGRIWWFLIYMGNDGRWHIGFSLSYPSFPAHPEAVLVIKAHNSNPDSATQPEDLQMQY